MLTPDLLKPYLLHEDRFLRFAAIDYFADCWSRDPDLVPTILDACDRYGDRENIRGTSSLDHFPLTAASLDRILDHLARTESEDTIDHLNRAIAGAPPELLVAGEAALREHPGVLPEIRPRLERRREFVGWSGERLWQELQDFARRSEDKHDTGEIDLAYADDLVDALARHDVPDDETLCKLLGDLEPDQGWLEIFLVDLAGARRVAQAIPALVRKFRIDTDYLLERCKEALARIGDPVASRLIREAYPGAEDNFRLFTAGVFGAIKHPDSEAAILTLLQTERDRTYRTILCVGLCELFSESGVEVVRREIASGAYDTTYTSLEEHLLPVVEVLGIELPEADRWRRQRAERERRLAARMAELECLEQRFEARRSQRVEPLAGLAQDEVERGEATHPIRREQNRVGRNDPCPCGSGKKYKKCCGRAG